MVTTLGGLWNASLGSGDNKFPMWPGPFQQALHPLLATSGPLSILLLRCIQSSLMGATVSSTSAFDRGLNTIQYNTQTELGTLRKHK